MLATVTTWESWIKLHEACTLLHLLPMVKLASGGLTITLDPPGKLQSLTGNSNLRLVTAKECL